MDNDSTKLLAGTCISVVVLLNVSIVCMAINWPVLRAVSMALAFFAGVVYQVGGTLIREAEEREMQEDHDG